MSIFVCVFIATVLIRFLPSSIGARSGHYCLNASAYPQSSRYAITFPVRLSSQVSLHLILGKSRSCLEFND